MAGELECRQGGYQLLCPAPEGIALGNVAEHEESELALLSVVPLCHQGGSRSSARRGALSGEVS